MGIDITRLQQKKADGSYDIVHPETQAKAVWMSDGRSVEEAVGAGGDSGGGGDVFNVTANVAFGSGYDVTLSNVSHTYDEIYGAFKAGKVVALTMMIPGGADATTYVAYLNMDSEYAQQDDMLYFACNGYAMVIQISMTSTGEIYGRWCNYVPVGAPASGFVYAGDNYQTPDTSLLRNSKLVSTDTTPTVEGEIFWTYG